MHLKDLEVAPPHHVWVALTANTWQKHQDPRTAVSGARRRHGDQHAACHLMLAPETVTVNQMGGLDYTLGAEHTENMQECPTCDGVGHIVVGRGRLLTSEAYRKEQEAKK
jgi:hypothetical protein